MAKLRVHLYSIGDPHDINTWANVPYFFLSSLEHRGVEVRGFNIIPEENLALRLTRFLTKIALRVIAALQGSRHKPGYFRSGPVQFLVRRNLRFLARKHGQPDVNLFLTFSFSSFEYSSTPVVHYCDRTYGQFLEEIGGRPTRRDRRVIALEKKNLENAALVLTLNEPCRAYIQERYGCENVRRLEAGINLETLEAPDPEALIAHKERSKDILFIGRGVEMRGVDILISAFQLFNSDNGNAFRLHVVGVGRDELKNVPEGITLYPYLRKDDPSDLRIYNRLLASSRLFVMPMRRGPLPGVIREAHWACTPVIISNVSNASERVRHEMDGVLVDSFRPEDFALQMSRLMSDRARWREMALEARRSVAHNTWDRTAQEFLCMLADRGITRSNDRVAV